MTELEVWILDDHPEEEACRLITEYAEAKEIKKLRKAKDLKGFDAMILKYQSEQSRASVLAFLDYYGPGNKGMALSALRSAQSSLGRKRFIAVLLSNLENPSEDSVVAGLFKEWAREGGHYYLPKEDVTDTDLGKYRLEMIFEKALQTADILAQAEKTEDRFKRQTEKDKKQIRLIGKSTAMGEIHEKIGRYSQSSATVLLEGENGTGKGLVAQAIHYASPRADCEFVSINCSALAETLLESELFGYVKGAFTDAKSSKKGLLDMAPGGTIFLDEVGEMGREMQVKLLRFLESKKFRPVGGTRETQVDIRVIGATNRVLQDEIKKANFRQDLYFRLAVLPLTIPPLRERKEDIPDLANHILETVQKKYPNKKAKGFSDEAVNCLKAYGWPGNVRELENIIERIVLLTDKQLIDVTDLPQDIQRPKANLTFKADYEEWKQFREELCVRTGGGGLPDWRKFNEKILLTENEINEAVTSVKTLDEKRKEVMQDFFMRLLGATMGDVPTIKDVLKVKSECTIVNWMSQCGVSVEKKGSQLVVVQR